MKPAWGNPAGLKIRSIDEKSDNMFVAEFGSKVDLDRVLVGSPWIAGKHAVILKEYDEKLKPSEIRFDRMDIWVRILNLPLGWMNQHRGIRAMSLLGEVRRMDVDEDGKASGAFLRARVAIDINKPIKRGVLLRMSRDGEPEWFDAQYEKLPFLCFSCGMLGHSGLECGTPAVRNAQGKLPYDRDIPLRAPDDRRRKLQSFSDAAAESFGSGSSSGARVDRTSSGRREERGTASSKDERRSAPDADGREHAAVEDPEVTSPLKEKEPAEPKGKNGPPSNVGRQLYQEGKGDKRKLVKKRKSKQSGPSPSMPPDLILPAEDMTPLVPRGLVSSRVTQMVGLIDCNGDASDELSKKQKTSAAAAQGSPRRKQ